MSNPDCLTLDPILSDEEIKSHAGQAFSKNDFSLLIQKDTDAFTPNGLLIFSFRKNVIPKHLSELGTQVLLYDTQRKTTTSRGYASGKVDLSKFSKNVIELLDTDKVKSRVRFSDGRTSTYKLCNKTHSMISGYIDGKALNDYKLYKNPTDVKGRPTAFTSKNPQDWASFVPLVQHADRLFKSLYTEQYNIQKKQLEKCPYIIADTVFTTVTTNWNFRTHLHKDKGNLKDAYSAFFVCENNPSDKPKWHGAYLGYPQYDVAVDVREGDFLLMNPHLYHCNTEFEFPNGEPESYDRLSFVLYARQKLI